MGEDETQNNHPEDARADSNRYLTFWTDNQLFGLSIADVVQIVGMYRVTKLPGSSDYVKGVVSLRGELLPVIDVRMRLGRVEKQYNDRTCIIIIKIQHSLLGFIVEALDKVCNIPDEAITFPINANFSSENTYLTGIAKLRSVQNKEEKIIMLVNMEKLLSDKEFVELVQSVH
ncbi:MAG: purine-binding chemotaxis protein CheW [Clostridia bacterium]|nr:purine-binding chemotaxis protein CheW [Clostridia bacterium]